MSNILLLTTPFRPNIGGVETHLDDLISEGVKKGFSFLVLTYQPLVTKASGKFLEYHRNFSVIRIPWIRLNLFLKLEKYPLLEFIYLFPGLFLSGFILLILKNSHIKIIHTQGLVAGTVGMILGKIFFKKVIVSTHSIYNFPKEGLYRGFVEFLFNQFDHVLTLSRQSKKEIESLGVVSGKVSVFTYWVDQKVFRKMHKKKVRKKLRIVDGGIVCLFVGRLIAVKGVSELLEAAKITDKKINFLVAGDGPLAKDVQAISKKYQNINFIGKIENDKLPLYYNAADILIVPSIHEEGFGRVIIEAMSCGAPVIAANRGGIKESLPREAGYLIDITPKSIKKILEKVSRNKQVLKKKGDFAYRFAKRRYGASNVKMITKYYEV